MAFDSAQATCSPGLVGRASEGGEAAEHLVELHKVAAGGGKGRRALEQLGMDEVHGADVERGRHADTAAERGDVADEVEGDGAVVEAAVHMGAGHVDEAGRSDRLADPQEELHGQSGGRTIAAVEKPTVYVAQVHHGRTSLMRATATFGNRSLALIA